MCNTQKWMESVSDGKLISELTIPGTHDSATYNPKDWSALAPVQATQCQTLSIEDQLKNGVRFLDIRLKNDNGLRLYHNVVDLKLTFEADILAVCKGFLEANPTETILMSIKNESEPNKSSTESIAAFFKLLTSTLFDQAYKNIIYNRNELPLLGGVRGKIVLFRRFAIPEKTSADFCGLNITDNFPDDTSSGFTNETINYYVQDAYKSWDEHWTSTVPKAKFDNHVKPCLVKAVSDGSPTTIYLNFLSATGMDAGIIGNTTPKYLSDTVNPCVITYLGGSGQGKNRFGIVIIDFPTPDLIKALIKSNGYHD